MRVNFQANYKYTGHCFLHFFALGLKHSRLAVWLLDQVNATAGREFERLNKWMERETLPTHRTDGNPVRNNSPFIFVSMLLIFATFLRRPVIYVSGTMSFQHIEIVIFLSCFLGPNTMGKYYGHLQCRSRPQHEDPTSTQ